MRRGLPREEVEVDGEEVRDPRGERNRSTDDMTIDQTGARDVSLVQPVKFEVERRRKVEQGGSMRNQ